MFSYIRKRLIHMVIIIALVSIVSFFLIQLPPGDFLSSYLLRLEASGTTVNATEIAALRVRYGLDRPAYVQYFIWIKNIILHGDFGRSFQWGMPVSDVIWDRLVITIAIGMATLFFVYLVAIPIGIYSALRQYSVGDFVITSLGYFGLALPGFILALGALYLAYLLGFNAGGLNSAEFLNQPMSWAKFWDMLQHVWLAIVVMGAAGIAGTIRIMRGMLLDEIGKQYVVTARAKGLSESRLILKYPVRIALNPVVSTIGWQLAAIISGAPIVEMVLNLPTTGSVLLRSLQSQDMYLAGSFVFLLSVLTVVGTFVSDILLVILDPRIKLGYEN
ncbi:MAG: ABC transporter permease [Bacteroidetes bacterium]|nr:ABC transporter permease [Bacteroidota bacterium]